MCTCVLSEVWNKGSERHKAYFFPRRHEVLVGFEDVRQSLLDVFLLHAGQHSRGQKQWKTPLLPAEGTSNPINTVCLPINAFHGTKEKNLPRKDTNLLDVLERDLLALPGRHGEDVHLQGSQSQRSVRLQFRAEALQDHVVATLQQSGDTESHQQSIFEVGWRPIISPLRHSRTVTP